MSMPPLSPLPPLPPPTPPSPLRMLLHYLIGVALGSVPVVALLLISYTNTICPRGALSGSACTPALTASGQMACIFGLLYVAQLVLTLPLLRDEEWRSIGYGLLTMLFVGPVVAVQACSLLTSPPPA